MSTPEVKFYHNAPDRLRAACAIAGKALKQGYRILVFAPDENLGRQFDHLLWTAQPLSFVPHVLRGSPLADRTPVLISPTLADGEGRTMLLNLDDQPVDDVAPFELVVEIVSQDAADRQSARQRWQFYKGKNYPITAYDLARPS